MQRKTPIHYNYDIDPINFDLNEHVDHLIDHPYDDKYLIDPIHHFVVHKQHDRGDLHDSDDDPRLVHKQHLDYLHAACVEFLRQYHPDIAPCADNSGLAAAIGYVYDCSIIVVNDIGTANYLNDIDPGDT